MRTVGVDLAAEPTKTAVACVDWTDGAAHVVDLVLGARDQAVVDRAVEADKIGIDCPLGWPQRFVDFVSGHAIAAPPPPTATIADRRPLVYRETDLFCMTELALRPMSVAADRIGHAALRCAGLLAALGERDRSGFGRVVEVYPAGSLQHWGIAHRRYKGPRTDALTAGVDALLAAAPWLLLGASEEMCRRSDDAFDAVVAALAARAAALGHATLPTAGQLAVARIEGWIAIPTGSLASLVGGD